MARVSVFPNGVTGGFVRSGPLAEEAPKRGKVKGWSVKTTRRLRRWFFSVDAEQVDGLGFALTLTVRDCPATPADWARVRRAFLERLRRLGFVRLQWLTEFQRRGVPHLHMCVYFPRELAATPSVLLSLWVEVAGKYGAQLRGQSGQEITGLVGWLQYQAKHSVRGVQHVQRSTVPEAWREGTGRLWGHLGAWPLREEVIEVTTGEFHRLRRGIKGYLLGQARWDARRLVDPQKRAAAARRAVWLRGLLRDSERARSTVRGIGEFCPEVVTRGLLALSAGAYSPRTWVDRDTGEVLSGFAAWERTQKELTAGGRRAVIEITE